MREWDLNVQRMLDFIELHLAEPMTLDQVAKRLGYSPWYCTRRFRQILGLPFRTYLGMRRLSVATLELRDREDRVLEIALRWGFGSQEAFTRAFKRAYGLSPGAYRRSPVPLPLAPVRRTLMPISVENPMLSNARQRITTTLQSLPAHRFLGLRNLEASGYFEFWEKQKDVPGLDCHTVIGLLDSIPSRNGQIGGWFHQDGRLGYLYGIEVPVDYAGEVPKGMECTLIPASEYVVFHHPAYDFEREDQEVYAALQDAMAAWKPELNGYAFEDTLPTYQRHASDTWGQAFCRPIRRLGR